MQLLFGNLFDYDKKKNSVLFIILSTVVLISSGALTYLLPESGKEYVSEIALMVCFMVLPYFRFKPQNRMTFCWVGLMTCSLMDFVECWIESLFPVISRILTCGLYLGLYIICSALVIVFTKAFRAPVIQDFCERIPAIIYIVVFVANYSAYYSFTLKSNMESSAEFASVLHYFSTVLSALGIGYIIYRYTKLAHLQKENDKVHALELERYEEIIRKNADVRAFRHDYKNNLFAVETFLQTGRQEEAMAYIRGMTDSLQKTSFRYQSGNILADAILSDKAEAAKEYGITFDFDGIIPSNGIGNRDLCAILSNALDNAIEACKKLSSSNITIRSTSKPGGVIFVISNPVSETVPIKNGLIQTSKSDKLNHGFGISNIRKAAKQYNGYVECTCQNLMFTIEIGLVFS